MLEEDSPAEPVVTGTGVAVLVSGSDRLFGGSLSGHPAVALVDRLQGRGPHATLRCPVGRGYERTGRQARGAGRVAGS